MIIRPPTPADLPALAALRTEKLVLLSQADRRVRLSATSSVAWQDAAWRWLTDPSCVIAAAEVDGRLIGYIVGWLQNAPPGMEPPRYGAVTEIALDAHGYYPGAGRALVAAVREGMRARGAGYLMVWAARRAAVEQAFWRSLGAKVWMDGLWMAL